MKIDLNEKEIQEQVSKAIVDSAIGKTIIESINDQFLGYKAKDAIQKAVEGQISVIARNIVMDEFKPLIEQKIREKLDEKLINEMVNGYINKFHDIDFDKLF